LLFQLKGAIYFTMNKIKEFMKEMTTQGWITTAIVGALLIVIGVSAFIGFTHYSKKGDLASSTSDAVFVPDMATSTAEEVTSSDVASDQVMVAQTPESVFVSGTQTAYTPPVVSYSAAPQEVKVGLIIAKNVYDVKNIIAGSCGDVYMVTTYVRGPELLTNSLRALFGDKIFGDFLPGNIIPTYHPNLTFEKVTISSGVARVYLHGSFSSAINGSCDKTLALAQIAETAKAYPTVSTVEIYLDSEKVN
jgi:Sporulation and spore germination